MSTKNINTRVSMKTDTTENWAKATNFSPLKGEMIIYQDTGKAPKVKVGDGSTNVNDLEFMSDVYTFKLQGAYNNMLYLHEIEKSGLYIADIPKTGNYYSLQIRGKRGVGENATIRLLASMIVGCDKMVFYIKNSVNDSTGNRETDAIVVGKASAGSDRAYWCTYTADTDTWDCGYKLMSLKTENTDEYTPTSDYNPATKKYVDDTVNAVSSTIVQSDWNQNDTTATDYVKNRPFYTKDPVETVILEETSVETGSEAAGVSDIMLYSDSSLGYATISLSSELTESNTYAVIFDGNRYVCNPAIFENMLYIGNLNILGAGENTGEPFLIVNVGNQLVSDPSSGIYMLATEQVGTYTIAISEIKAEVVELPEKYISYKPGKKVTGETFTVNKEEITAAKGAEIFNDYNNNIATGECSHAEGRLSTASGAHSHAEGYGTIASGVNSHAEVYCTTASGTNSHAEGMDTTASGTNSHAEGSNTTASSREAHAEGCETTASGDFSHAEGAGTKASGNSSHAEGYQTIASSKYQHVQGKHNIEDTANTYAHIIGNGESNTSPSNAHTIDWDGNAWFAGEVKIGGYGQEDSRAKTLATTEDVDNALTAAKAYADENDSDTTYSAATTSEAGLMSADDKSKLDGISSSADAVDFSANATSGNKVGTITINGTATDMYSPTQTTVSGNAGTATKLATARTIQTNLGSTLSASFDGSGNVTPGVTGTLPIKNGGTGATTAADALTNLGLTATTTELNYCDGVTSNIQTQLNGKAPSSHTHSYAGSSSAGGSATSAEKLNSSAGSATNPVYFSGGKPVACTYSLNKTVPSDAVFTDTNTEVTNTLATTTKAYLTGTTSASTNTGTQVFDTGVYLDTTAGRLCVTSIGIGSGILTYDSTNEALKVTFS